MGESLERIEWAEHGRFLRNLARSFVGEGADTDDLVQETWLRAIERPPRDGSNPRGWLGKVLVNVFRERERGGRRRRRREEERESSGMDAPTSEVLERAELAQRVSLAVAGLDDSYRTVVHLRFYEDLPPRDIARVLGLPVETVKTRLKRANAELRRRLDGDFGDRASWLALLLPMANSAPVFPMPVSPLEGGLSSLTKVLLMTTNAKLATGLACASLLTALYLWPRAEAPQAKETPAVVANEPRALEPPVVDSDEPAPARMAAPVPAATAKPEVATPAAVVQRDVTGTLVVYARDVLDLEAPTGTLEVVLADPNRREILELEVVDGSWQTTIPEGIEHLAVVGAVVGGRRAVPLERIHAVGPLALEIAVRWLPEARLRVVDDATGADLRNVEVRLRNIWRAIGRDEHPGESSFVATVLSKVDSPFDLPPAARHRTYWAWAPGYAWGRIALGDGVDGEHTVRLLRGADARVIVQGKLPEGAFLRLRSAHEAPFHDAEFPLASEVEVRGLRPGRYVVSAERGEFTTLSSVGSIEAELVEGIETTVRLFLDPELLESPMVPLGGTIVLPSGAEEDDLRLTIEQLRSDSGRKVDRIQIEDLDPVGGDPLVRSFPAVEVPPGDYIVWVHPFAHRAKIEVGPNGDRNLRLELPALAEVRVSVRDAVTGETLRPKGLRWSDGPLPEVRTNASIPASWDDDHGAFAFRTVAGEVEIGLDDPAYLADSKPFELRAGTNAFELAARRSTRIAITLFDGNVQQTLDETFWYGVSIKQATSYSSLIRRSVMNFKLEEEGTYTLQFPALEGYEPIEEREVHAVYGEETPCRIDLVRER